MWDGYEHTILPVYYRLVNLTISDDMMHIFICNTQFNRGVQKIGSLKNHKSIFFKS